MIELATTIVVVGGAIAATVAAGSHYLASGTEIKNISEEQAHNFPLVRPNHPSGQDWPKGDQA